MTDNNSEWPELVVNPSEADFITLGEQGIDRYACEGARYDVYYELKEQYEAGKEQFDLREFREKHEDPDSVLEDAINMVMYVDDAPIEVGPTAFVGWFTDT